MSQVDMKRWRPHLRAARVAGVTLAQYAREHGLSRHTLYAALRAERDRKDARAKPLVRARTAKRQLVLAGASAFVPVAVSATPLHVTVRLLNGMAVECHAVQEDRLSGLIASLAALPCSG
jgi:hypothetical protein